MSKEILIGDAVVMNDHGLRQFPRRTGMIGIVQRSEAGPGRAKVKWDRLATPETLSLEFIKLSRRHKPTP